MARIMDNLKVQLNVDGTSLSLIDELTNHVGAKESEEIVVVPAGFRTNFTNVPWFARWFISSRRQTARAAVIHDYLYSTEGKLK